MKRVCKKDGKIIISIYSENAYKDQIQFYKNIGLTITYYDSDFVYTKEDFKSERFSKEKIKNLIESVGLKVTKIVSLNPISYIVEAKKK